MKSWFGGLEWTSDFLQIPKLVASWWVTWLSSNKATWRRKPTYLPPRPLTWHPLKLPMVGRWISFLKLSLVVGENIFHFPGFSNRMFRIQPKQVILWFFGILVFGPHLLDKNHPRKQTRGFFFRTFWRQKLQDIHRNPYISHHWKFGTSSTQILPFKTGDVNENQEH